MGSRQERKEKQEKFLAFFAPLREIFFTSG